MSDQYIFVYLYISNIDVIRLLGDVLYNVALANKGKIARRVADNQILP